MSESEYIKKDKKNFAMNLPILGLHHELMFKVDNFKKYINPINNHHDNATGTLLAHFTFFL